MKWPKIRIRRETIERTLIVCSAALVLLLSLSYIPVMRIAFSLITVTISSYLIDWIRAYGLEKKAAEKDRQSPQAETRLSAEAAD